MLKHPLSAEELMGSREIRLIDRKESNYPNLKQLCTDFDFRVLQLLHKTTEPTVNKPFILVTKDYRLTPTAAISPAFATLEQLETHVHLHQVDILHNYLFGFVDEDILSSSGLSE
ncbi:hypothetical protein [Marinimicrobium locisalis]|uniref:hypothetical protein n=1 Tax=Marinimicrobium locisalis TaxID=546022 RepID=UPI00322192D1